jgi:hypothetical protein
MRRRIIQFLPVAPFLALIAFHATSVDPYPAQIGVAHRSCADSTNSGRLTFRQQTFCVTPAEAKAWNAKWNIEYALMAVLVLCWVISSVARRRQSSVD